MRSQTMAGMTGKERISRIMRHEPVDRIGLYEHFWGDTHKAWRDAGKIADGEPYADHFGFDLEECWPFNLVADLEAKIPIVKQGYNFVVHSDHSIPKTVNYETYRYFIDKALELGKY